MTLPTFPVSPSMIFPVKRSPEVQGIALQAWSGRRTWLPNWPWPIYHYEVGFSGLRAITSGSRASEFQNMLGFWNLVMTTPGGYFQFNDPDDTTAAAQRFGTGDGATTVFQLTRSLGGFVEPVRAPATITSIKVNGTPTGAYTLGAGGIITFTAPPASSAALTWDGTYNWLCQFDQTTVDFQNFAYQLYSLDKVTFQTALP